jgi:nitrite reductase/ring-hydroxylating ferredoxin subunit
MQVRVTEANNFTEGEMRVFDIDGIKVSVAAAGGRLFAFDDVCTHRGCSLGEGELEGSTVTCPCHGSQFNVTTGAVIRGPAQQPVRSRSVESRRADLLVES